MLFINSSKSPVEIHYSKIICIYFGSYFPNNNFPIIPYYLYYAVMSKIKFYDYTSQSYVIGRLWESPTRHVDHINDTWILDHISLVTIFSYFYINRKIKKINYTIIVWCLLLESILKKYFDVTYIFRSKIKLLASIL